MGGCTQGRVCVLPSVVQCTKGQQWGHQQQGHQPLQQVLLSSHICGRGRRWKHGEEKDGM